MDPISLEKSLSKGDLESVYVFHAEEDYWVQRLSEALSRALKKKYGEVEEIRFDEEDWQLDRLLSELGSYSMFAGHRFLKVPAADKIKKADWEKVAAALGGETLGFTLLLICERKDTFKEASKSLKGSEAVECAKPKVRDVPSIAVQFGKDEGKTLNLSDARILIDLVGPDLLTLQNQIRLLAVFVGEKGSISGEDIHRLFSQSAEQEVFALTRALSEGDSSQAFSSLRRILGQGEPPVRLLALLARHYRLVFKAKLLLKKGKGPSEIASHLKVAPFFLDQYLDPAQTIPWKKAIRALRELSATDRALKGSPLPPDAHLEKFLFSCFE